MPQSVFYTPSAVRSPPSAVMFYTNRSLSERPNVKTVSFLWFSFDHKKCKNWPRKIMLPDYDLHLGKMDGNMRFHVQL